MTYLSNGRGFRNDHRPVKRYFGVWILTSFAFTLLLGSSVLPQLFVPQASAEVGHHSHFRGGTITWIPTGNKGEVQFSVIDGFRRSAYSGTAGDGMPAVGDTILETTGATSLNFGDFSSTGTLTYQVDFIDVTNDWLLGHAVDTSTGSALPIKHTYATSGPFEAGFQSSARTFLEVNNPGGAYAISTTVDLSKTGSSGTNQSPVSSFIPIYTCPVGLCTFAISAADVDGDSIKFRLSTDVEASGFTAGFTQPTGLAVNPTTGVVTWNTTGLTLGLWSASVWMDEMRSRSAIGHIQNDFLINVVQSTTTNNAPAFDYPPTPAQGTAFTPHVGDTVSFTVQCTDPDAGDTATLGIIGQPAGSSFTGTLSGANPGSGTFSYTPSAVEVDAITFTCQDNNGNSATPTSVSIVTSILVVPESPLGTALLIGTSLAAFGGFMFWRSRRNNSGNGGLGTSGSFGLGL